MTLTEAVDNLKRAAVDFQWAFEGYERAHVKNDSMGVDDAERARTAAQYDTAQRALLEASQAYALAERSPTKSDSLRE